MIKFRVTAKNERGELLVNFLQAYSIRIMNVIKKRGVGLKWILGKEPKWIRKKSDML